MAHPTLWQNKKNRKAEKGTCSQRDGWFLSLSRDADELEREERRGDGEGEGEAGSSFLIRGSISSDALVNRYRVTPIMPSKTKKPTHCAETGYRVSRRHECAGVKVAQTRHLTLLFNRSDKNEDQRGVRSLFVCGTLPSDFVPHKLM